MSSGKLGGYMSNKWGVQSKTIGGGGATEGGQIRGGRLGSGGPTGPSPKQGLRKKWDEKKAGGMMGGAIGTGK